MAQDNPNDPVTPTAQSAEPSANARGAEPITEATLVSDDDAANVDEPATDQSEEETDDRSEIEKQPYDFDRCTIQIAIQLLPDDGDANGRMVVVGVRSHLDAPILRLVRWNELGALPPFVTTLLDELKADLPKREQAAREAFEKNCTRIWRPGCDHRLCGQCPSTSSDCRDSAPGQ